MKKVILFLITGGLCGMVSAEPIHYLVGYKNNLVATQTVDVVWADNGDVTLHASFAAELPVFVTLQPYSEDISVTYRPDGEVLEWTTTIVDSNRRFYVMGRPDSESGGLQVIREFPDDDGPVTNQISRDEYDYSSLFFYTASVSNLLVHGSDVRILDVTDGTVHPVKLSSQMEGITWERQHVPTMHLFWKDGIYTSQSWHPDRFSPSPYIRQNGHGEMEFRIRR